MIDMYLLHRKNSKTGIRLAAALGWAHGSSGDSIEASGKSVVIRYGNRLSLPSGLSAIAEYNSQSGIAAAADKLQALETLNAAGIPALKILRFENPTLPCLGRTRVHERGSGFFVCRTAADVTAAKLDGAEYFVPWLENFREYRVNVFFGKVLRTVFKRSADVWEGTSIQREAEGIAVKAVKELGLSFGAVDIIKHAGGWKILEVNTAPDVDGPDFLPWLKALRDIEAYHKALDIVSEVGAKYEGLG